MHRYLVAAGVICPACGAPETACEARFHEFLALEFTDAGYGAVHHLTVAAYMLQHSSQLTPAGWIHMRGLLREFLLDGKSPAFIRKQNKNLVDSDKRDFNIKSRTGQPVIAKTTWAKTILDVRAENAEIYCADVTAWAKSMLEEAGRLDIR
jgi:hypothetical protein